MRWLFPGMTVRIEAPCLDCGDRVVIEMTDHEVRSVDPPQTVGYSYSQVGGSPETRAYR